MLCIAMSVEMHRWHCLDNAGRYASMTPEPLAVSLEV